MSYLTFDTEAYDWAESDRTDRNHPQPTVMGEDDLWADHTQSCKYEAPRWKHDGQNEDGSNKWFRVQDAVPTLIPDPMKHSDMDNEKMDIYDSEYRHPVYTDRREDEATSLASSEPLLTEETTRTETSDPPSIITPTMRRADFIAATPTPAVMRVEALRRMYRRTKSEANRHYIAFVAAEVKESEPNYAGKERYAQLLAERNTPQPDLVIHINSDEDAIALAATL